AAPRGKRGRPSAGFPHPVPDRNRGCARPERPRTWPRLVSGVRRSRRGSPLKRQAYPFHPFENESGGPYPAYLVYAFAWPRTRTREIFTCEALSPSNVVNAPAMLQVKDPEAFQESVVRAQEPTVVMFWATWCPFCRLFKQEFEKLAASRAGRFAAVYLDDEDNPLWEDYAVEVVPTLALFRGGKL